MEILKTLFFDPIFNALITFYNVLGNMGLAIIALTILIRIILLPFANKALRSQRRLQALQPELKKLQEKHKDDREKLAQELMAFYKREGVNPASSCLPVLIQLPVLATLFFVFRDAIQGTHLDSLYSFVARPESINPNFLGLNLSQTAAQDPGLYALALLAAVFQFIQSKMLLPKDNSTPAVNRQIVYIFPVLTFVFAITLPGALPLYWATQALFAIIQQRIIIAEMPLTQAAKEGAIDWNEANPEDPVALPGKKKGSTTVNVKKRKK